MKKILLCISLCLLLTGCGKYTIENAKKDLEKKIEQIDGYQLTGELTIINNDDKYIYEVNSSYSKEDQYKVSLTNTTNNHQQIILKNEEGVYVLTPSLNKSFKFQSDWPYNNSQVYLLQTLLNDIQNDSNAELEKNKNEYIFNAKANYPNNTKLKKQKIYFDKKLNPKRVEVTDSNGTIQIKMEYKKINLKSKFDKDYFELEKNMKTSKTKETLKKVGEINDDIYPLYIPSNTTLKSTDKIKTKSGQRLLMNYEGEKSFTLIEETVSKESKPTIESVNGEPYVIATSVAAVSNNMISWINDGVEYSVVSNNLEEDEFIEVAKSVSTIPISK